MLKSTIRSDVDDDVDGRRMIEREFDDEEAKLKRIWNRIYFNFKRSFRSALSLDIPL
jgi:hypothetical protein